MAAYDKNLKAGATASTHSSSRIRPHLLRLFALYENMTRFVLPLCSALPRPNPETPISSTTNIVDITGVGLKQFWNLKSHMQDASTLATAHYPETLDRIFVSHTRHFFHYLSLLTPSLPDHRRTLLLPHSLGLDKTLVRPGHDLQNLHPEPARSRLNPLLLHRARILPETLRWRARVGLGLPS